MLKSTSPLLIPTQEFDSFDDYFQSLTKSCRNSLTLPKQKRLMDGLEYRQLGWDGLMGETKHTFWNTKVARWLV